MPTNLTHLLLQATARREYCIAHSMLSHEKPLHNAIVKNACSLAFGLGNDWLETSQMTLDSLLFLDLNYDFHLIVGGSNLLIFFNNKFQV